MYVTKLLPVLYVTKLLPYLVLDRKKFMTIPIHIQYLQGSYGTVDLGATTICRWASAAPIPIFRL